MPSAEERKKRFLELKEQSGGSVAGIVAKENTKPLQLFFKDNGDITCITKEDDAFATAKSSAWQSWNFPNKDIAEVLANGYNKYHVTQDDQGSYHIALRPIIIPTFRVDNSFITEITTGNNDAEIECTITKNSLILKASDAVKEYYKDTFPISATRNGVRVLKFFITEVNDPHVVFYYKTVLLGELLVNDQLEFPLVHDFRQHSLYTRKLFDTYLRTDHG